MKVHEWKEKAHEEGHLARQIQEKADQETRHLTEDEVLEMKKHLDEARRCEQQAERQADLESLETRLNKAEDKKVPIAMETGARVDVVSPRLFRYGELRAFKASTKAEAEKNAYASGKWLLAAVMGNAEARQWCRDHGIGLETEKRVQTEGVNTAGGYLVPDVFERAVIDLRETYGTFRANCRVLPMSSDHTIVPRRTGGVTAYFIGETTEITASDKSWNQVELTAKKLAALTRMSTDLSDDAIINVADDIAQEMAYAFATKEDQCGIDGDGTATYGNMSGVRTLMADGVHLGGYVDATATHDLWSEIDAADLTRVMAALPMYARTNAKWYCSPVCRASVFDRLLAALGGVTMREGEAGTQGKYLGYPIVEMAAMPTSDTGGALNHLISLFFGDLRLASTLGDRRGITVKVSNERYLEYDQVGIQATQRFCIVNHDIGGAAATTRGPVVGLYMHT